jgi:hypothetical protein
MRVFATIHPPEATQAILSCLALPARAPPLRAARTDGAYEESAAFAVDGDADLA